MSRKKKTDDETAPTEIPYRTTPFYHACDMKRVRGIEEHGDTYEGDPVEDALAEVCDCENYIRFAEMMGHDIHQTAAIRSRIVELSAMIRELPPIPIVPIKTDW